MPAGAQGVSRAARRAAAQRREAPLTAPSTGPGWAAEERPGYAARPGRLGRWPPRLSMARAIRASGERKPNAIRVSSRILVLTDSIKALDSPWSRLAWILSRIAVMRLARWTKARMRQRHAQDSHRSKAILPASPLAMNT